MCVHLQGCCPLAAFIFFLWSEHIRKITVYQSHATAMPPSGCIAVIRSIMQIKQCQMSITPNEEDSEEKIGSGSSHRIKL